MSKALKIATHLDDLDDNFLEAVVHGLSQPQKVIPARFFYDQRGSELFEDITQLEEYYPTRTEIGLFEAHGRAMAEELGEGVALIEPGSGSSRKTPLILRHLVNPAAYVPVDIAEEFLAQSAQALAAQFPGLKVLPVAADFTQEFILPDAISGVPHAGFFPGSTIGNFEPQAAVPFLNRLGQILGKGAKLLIGVDVKKDPAVLERAYDDAAGVTAAFNLNLLTRANRELGANFDLASFKHCARYNAVQGRVEMHLVSLRDQSVKVGGKTFLFAKDETIHTENSYKYTPEEFRLLARISGWQSTDLWLDERRYFSVHLLTFEDPPASP